LPALPGAKADGKQPPPVSHLRKTSVPGVTGPTNITTSASARARGVSTAVGASAPPPNPLQDGATFVEKDCVTSVLRLLETLQQKDAVRQPVFRRLLQYVITVAENGSLPAEPKQAISEDNELLPLFTGIYDLLGSAVRQKVKENVFVQDLNKMQMPSMFATDFIQAFNRKRESLFQAACFQRITLPSITDLEWRVDVTVSTTALSRVFRPSILMQITLSDNTVKLFECSVDKFHELRYNVAKLLKGIQDLEQHPTLNRDLQ